MADATPNNPWKAGHRDPSSTYLAFIHCNNCEHDLGSTPIPYGVRVDTYLKITKCPKCGCTTLARNISFGY